MEFADILDNLRALDDWEERYRFLIDLGRDLPALADTQKTEASKVRGCASQVWLIADHGEGGDPVMAFQGDSDALIVKGLVALVLSLYSGKRAGEIQNIEPSRIFDEIGLKQHLSPQRSNGLASMVQRIRREAAEAMSVKP